MILLRFCEYRGVDDARRRRADRSHRLMSTLADVREVATTGKRAVVNTGDAFFRDLPSHSASA